MKLITAYIKPFKLNDVKKALEEIGVQGMSVTEVRGYGRQKGQSELYRGEEYEVAFLPKIRIEIATTNELAEKMIPAIIKAAQTGKVGDGKILVSDLENVYRIRTEESGIDALAEKIDLTLSIFLALLILRKYTSKLSIFIKSMLIFMYAQKKFYYYITIISSNNYF